MGSLLDIDEDLEAKRICSFIRETVNGAGSRGVVVGLSGGIDSSVVCALCVRAIGKKKVLGVVMPSESTPSADVLDAETLAESFEIETRKVEIGGLVRGLRIALGDGGTKVAAANLQARLRMTSLYYYANSKSRLVAGTGDRSELLVGFFTKWGDGGADFLPIAHLYKTQVRALGRHMGLPDKIVSKPSSPQLWPGHKAADELPADYDKLDPVLHYLFDMKLDASKAAAKGGVLPSVVMKVLEMNARTNHKRTLPPTIDISGEG